MHPYRIAVLVFLIGASLANFLAVRESLDRMGPGPGPPPTPTSSAAPRATGPFDLLANGDIMAERLADYKAALAARNEALSPIYDRAWMREAIVVTIAGVAWFLVRPRSTT
jgi:hypothetical protein